MATVSKDIFNTRNVRSAKRRSSRPKGKTTGSTGQYAADDFLKQTFLPVSALALKTNVSAESIQRRFLRSLHYVCNLYQREPVQLPDAPFPLNIYFGFQAFKEQFEQDHPLQTVITGTVEHPVVAVIQTLDTGFDLYYVPLELVHRLLLQRQKQPLAHLLLSTCHYLYQAGVSLCDDSGFIGYEMRMIRDSYADADELNEQEMKEYTQQADEVIACCRTLCERISDSENTVLFAERLQAMDAGSEDEQQLLTAITAIYELRSRFPNRHFTDRIVYRQDSDPEDNFMYPEQYLTFFWDGHSAFDEQVAEWIDSRLQETSLVKAPVSVQVFDQPRQATTHEFAFEEAFLNCIANLNTALYGYINR